MRLFLFNPENDIALASGLRYFTPPKQAMALHRAGAWLPCWLGEEGDYVLVHPEAADPERKCVARFADIPLREPLKEGSIRLMPWGWSLDAIEQFRRAGVAESLLEPFMAKVDGYRRLSHRQNQLKLLERLQQHGVAIKYPMPVCASEIDDVVRYVACNKQVMVKSPWSSSGRGVFPVTQATLAASVPRIKGIIRSQGAVMVEPLLTKLLDFALLFTLSSSGASYEGISVFRNSTATNYGGNDVASQASLRSIVTEYVSADALERLIAAMAASVREVYGGVYEGPLGVDMMVYAGADGKACICPCIEVNLRFTMGFVALGLYEKLHTEGVLAIKPFPTFEILFQPKEQTAPSLCLSFTETLKC